MVVNILFIFILLYGNELYSLFRICKTHLYDIESYIFCVMGIGVGVALAGILRAGDHVTPVDQTSHHSV